MLWDAISAIEEDTLHIATNEIGTHSIHLGAAMAMFLGGCPVFLIMMIGHWSSKALHSKTSWRIQLQRLLQNDHPYVLQAHTQLHISQAMYPSWKRQDIKKRRRGTWLDKSGCLLLPSLTEHYDQLLENAIVRWAYQAKQEEEEQINVVPWKFMSLIDYKNVSNVCQHIESCTWEFGILSGS